MCDDIIKYDEEIMRTYIMGCYILNYIDENYDRNDFYKIMCYGYWIPIFMNFNFN